MYLEVFGQIKNKKITCFMGTVSTQVYSRLKKNKNIKIPMFDNRNSYYTMGYAV